MVGRVGWSLNCLFKGFKFDFFSDHLNNGNKHYNQIPTFYRTTTKSN